MRWRGEVNRVDPDGTHWISTRMGAAWFTTPAADVGAALEFGLMETRQGLHAVDVILVDGPAPAVAESSSHTPQEEGS